MVNNPIDKILTEWAYRVHNGMPDPSDNYHVVQLEQYLNELRLPRRVVKKVLEKVRKYKDNKMNQDLGRVGEPWGSVEGEAGSKGEPKKDEPIDKEEKKKEREQKIKKTKKQIKIGEDLKEDLDFILENKDKVRLKSGGGSNSPSVQDVKDLQTFTQKRMEQDKRRLEAEEKGEEFMVDGGPQTGEYKDDLPIGEFYWEMKSGRKYVGELNRDGLFHGKGTLTHPDGKIEKGIWKMGELIKRKK